jgi:hypothetical protein
MKIRKRWLILIIMIVVIIFTIGFYFYKNSVSVPFKYGVDCKIESVCNNLVGVDCNSAADGPYYYIKRDTGELVARCGGYCDGRDCTNCPPKEWTCKRY